MDQIMSLLLCSLDLIHHYSNFPHQGSLSCWQTGLLRPSGCQPQLHVTMCGMISAPQLGSSLVMAMMSQQRYLQLYSLLTFYLSHTSEQLSLHTLFPPFVS